MAEVYNKFKHDIGITYSGVVYGLMLAKGKKDEPIWEEYDDEYLAEQMSVGTVGYSDLPPERELALVYDDWRSGFGEDVADPTDPFRYFSSTGCDLRHKNMAILSNGTTGIAVPSTTAPTAWCEFNDELYVAFGIYLTKLNGTGNGWTAVKTFTSPITDMKVFADGYMYIAVKSAQVVENCEDAWVGTGDTTASLDTGDYKVGSGSCKLVYDGTGANGDTLATEGITSLDLSGYTGIKMWIKVSSAVAAGDLYFYLSDAADASSKDDEMALPALTAAKWTRIHFRQIDPASNTAIQGVGLEYRTNEKVNTIHMDDIRAASSYWYMDTGENFTQSTLDVLKTDSFAEKFLFDEEDTMWKFLPPNRLQSSTDPTNVAAANWSTETAVGTSSTDITSLIQQKGSIFITKEGATYFIDAGGTIEALTDEMFAISSSTGGVNSISWKGSIYMPYGDSSLLEYDAGNNFNWIDPSLYCTNLSAFDGKVQALAGDEQWLYAIVDNGNSVEILAGRTEVIGGGAQWVWHPIQTLALTGCKIAFVSNIFQKRLWIGSTSGAESIYYIPLPLSYGNIASDTNRAFKTGGYFETPWYHFNFKGDDKSFIKITLNMEGTTSTVFWTGSYKKKGDAAYTTIGTFKTSPSTSQFIPVDSSSNNPTSTSMRFMFTATTGATTTTPILKSYDIRAVLYPSRRKIFGATVRCADGILNKEGKEMGREAANITTYIDAAKDATFPVTIYDPWGAAHTVNFLPRKPAAKIIKQEKGRNPEKHYYLLMQSVDLS